MQSASPEPYQRAGMSELLSEKPLHIDTPPSTAALFLVDHLSPTLRDVTRRESTHKSLLHTTTLHPSALVATSVLSATATSPSPFVGDVLPWGVLSSPAREVTAFPPSPVRDANIAATSRPAIQPAYSEALESERPFVMPPKKAPRNRDVTRPNRLLAPNRQDISAAKPPAPHVHFASPPPDVTSPSSRPATTRSVRSRPPTPLPRGPPPDDATADHPDDDVTEHELVVDANDPGSEWLLSDRAWARYRVTHPTADNSDPGPKADSDGGGGADVAVGHVAPGLSAQDGRQKSEVREAERDVAGGIGAHADHVHVVAAVGRSGFSSAAEYLRTRVDMRALKDGLREAARRRPQDVNEHLARHFDALLRARSKEGEEKRDPHGVVQSPNRTGDVEAGGGKGGATKGAEQKEIEVNNWKQEREREGGMVEEFDWQGGTFSYLMMNFAPGLKGALVALVKERPSDPEEFLCRYFHRMRSNGP